MSIDPPDWLEQWAKTVNLWDMVLLALGIVTAVLAIVWIRKHFWPWLVSFSRAVIDSARIIDAVKGLPGYIQRSDAQNEALAAKVDEIHHETHTNRGTSIKDAVGRVEEGVAGLYDRMDDLQQQVNALRSADDEIRAELEQTQPKEEP